ncbi:AIPR family protein [Vibrio cholerae]|uniref:AIPR family protein n=1 Tax=Vibrio cholerae TaxID=666 RepID=UPI001E4B312B|nr:AIPR family protein [Vibrio cholerae]MCD6668241.1 AIPR family protein [Vibrio cholerae]HDI3196433.1 AIPR family protein [Vibrio cholerae]
MDSKYSTLLNILDKIISEAPDKYKKLYSTNDDKKLEQARSRAYIHLYLMAKFGMLDFLERESLILDGPGDGGIDAYYIDADSKSINIIQSKFRHNKKNFESKEIEIDELLKMDITRILEGEICCENGNRYNGKVKSFQDALDKLKNKAKYEYNVIILANCKYDRNKLEKITGGYESKVIDFHSAYDELVYPVVSGNYYSRDDLEVSIDLSNSQHPRIQYNADLGDVDANITVLFVPTIEIARIMNKYKNAILHYNPRSYLDMRKNSVNSEIVNTLKESRNNEFALYNNGLTIVCSGCHFTEKTGRKHKASLSISLPQIINGGQTAFTLSKIYEEVEGDEEKIKEYFHGKEVLVKVISFETEDDEDDEDKLLGFLPEHLKIVENVSQATNRQNPIDDADRKANQESQVSFQKYAFKHSGLYYERKRGEFGDGISKGYLDRAMLIKRDDLVRCCFASAIEPGLARSASKKLLFGSDGVESFLKDRSKYESYIYAVKALLQLKEMEKSYRTNDDKYCVSKFGSAFRYGKYAVISAVFSKYSIDEIRSNLNNVVEEVMVEWKSFETWVREKEFKGSFQNDNNMLNFYKGSKIKIAIEGYFSKSI